MVAGLLGPGGEEVSSIERTFPNYREPKTTYGNDVINAAEKWGADCTAAVNAAASRYAGKPACGCADLTTMESIAIALAAGVEMDYRFEMEKVVISTKKKIGITWAGAGFAVAVLQDQPK